MDDLHKDCPVCRPDSPGPGVWLAYHWSESGHVVTSVHEHEIEAMRAIIQQGYGTVKFVEFGAYVPPVLRAP